jgi:hypothetical protein
MGACDALSALLGGAFTDNPAGHSLTSVPANSVLLIIENRAGSPVTATAFFEDRGEGVRQTTRYLTGDGPEATAEVLRTVAERITIRAWLTDSATALTQALDAKGVILAQREYLLDVDYHGGDTLLFIVPPLNDCNANLVPDATDITNGTSLDCNDNGAPDECDINQGVGQDADHNGVLDECEQPGGLSLLCPGLVTVPAGGECQGVVPDLSDLIAILGTPPPGLLVTQDPQAGTPLTLGTALDVSVVIGDSAGPIASCASTILLVDESAPILTVPEDALLPCSQPADPGSNPSVGWATAWDNCDPSPAVTYADDTGGLDDCQGQIIRTWTATDQSGNPASGVQTITILEPPRPSRVFWTTWGEPDGKIETANSDRSDRRVVLTTETFPLEIDVDPDGGHLFWVGHSHFDDFALHRATLNGEDPTALPVDAAGSLGVAVDSHAGNIYWTHVATSQPNAATSQPVAAAISRADLSGAHETVLVLQPPPSIAFAIAVSSSAGVICWTQASGCCDSYSLYTADLAGGGPSPIRNSPHPMTGVAVNGAGGNRSSIGAIYWVEQTGCELATIFTASLTGADVESVLVIPDPWVLNLAIDPLEGKLYWTQPLIGKIGRANLDGSGSEDFLTDLGPVSGIAVLPQGAPPDLQS